jgi:hypothetical protein
LGQEEELIKIIDERSSKNTNNYWYFLKEAIGYDINEFIE